MIGTDEMARLVEARRQAFDSKAIIWRELMPARAAMRSHDMSGYQTWPQEAKYAFAHLAGLERDYDEAGQAYGKADVAYREAVQEYRLTV